MKAKIFMVVMLMSLSAMVMAQTGDLVHQKQMMNDKMAGMRQKMENMRGMRGPGNGLNLTDAQKDAFKQSTFAVQKLLQPLHNELGEAQAHQKTLLSAEKPDFNAINKNIEKIGSIRVEMAKIQTKHRLDMRAQLTDEQRLKFDLFRHNMKQGKGQFGKNHRMI